MTAGGAGGAVLGWVGLFFFPFLLQFCCLDKASVTMQGDVAEPRCTPALVVAQWGHVSSLGVPSVGTQPSAQLGALGLAVPTSLPGAGGPSTGTSLPRDVRSSPAPRCLPAVALCYSNSGFMARTCLK